MTDGTDDLGQDEIEELLRQAAGDTAANAPADTSAPEPPPAAAERSQEPVRSTVEIGPPPEADAPAVPNPGNPNSGNSAANMDADVQFLLNQAEEALRSVDAPHENELEGLAPFELRPLTGAPANSERASLELLRDVELDMRIELGRTHMYLEDVLQLRKGSVVPLDKLAGDPADVYVNGRLVARGEVLVLNDNFCVRIAELISGDEAE